jgi:hypothetical protein
MEKKKNLFEKLKQIREEGVVGANVPTNSMASGKIAGSVEAGDDPPVRRKRKKYIYQKGLRKIWKPENGRAS